MQPPPPLIRHVNQQQAALRPAGFGQHESVRRRLFRYLSDCFRRPHADGAVELGAGGAVQMLSGVDTKLFADTPHGVRRERRTMRGTLSALTHFCVILLVRADQWRLKDSHNCELHRKVSDSTALLLYTNA